MGTMTKPTPTPSNASPLYRLVDAELNRAGQGPLSDYILSRRTPDNEVAFGKIARELSALTEVDVTHEAARRWYRLLRGSEIDSTTWKHECGRETQGEPNHPPKRCLGCLKYNNEWTQVTAPPAEVEPTTPAKAA